MRIANLHLLIFLSCALNATAKIEVVAIKGDITTTAYRDSGETVTNLTFGFNVSLHEGQWLIQTIYNPKESYFTGFDGTNTYAILLDHSSANNPYKNSSTNNPFRNNYPGTLCAGSIPINSDLWTVCPWFAFCSGAVLREKKTNDFIPAPWAMPRYDPNSCIFDLDVVPLSQPPYLPDECKFRASDALKNVIVMTDLVDSPDKDQNRLQMKLYPDGFLAGEYRVISTTNFGGLTFPLEFECKHFLPKLDKTNSWLAQLIHGRVSSISMEQLDSTQPPIPPEGQISLMDTRLRNIEAAINGFKYNVSNWPSQIPDDAAQEFAKRSRVKIINDANVPGRRRGIWIVILLVGLLPTLFLLKKRDQNSPQNPEIRP